MTSFFVEYISTSFSHSSSFSNVSLLLVSYTNKRTEKEQYNIKDPIPKSTEKIFSSNNIKTLPRGGGINGGDIEPAMGDNIVSHTVILNPIILQSRLISPSPLLFWTPSPPNNVAVCFLRYVTAIIQHWMGGGGIVAECGEFENLLINMPWKMLRENNVSTIFVAHCVSHALTNRQPHLPKNTWKTCYKILFI